MPLTMEEIAARIEWSFERATWPDIGHELFAETIEFRHDPTIPEFDGPWSKDALLFNLEQKNRAWRNSIPDLEFTKLEINTKGDTVTATYEVSGTARPDQRIAVQSRMQFTITDEKISGVLAWVEQSKVSALIEALIAGGYVRENERASTAFSPGEVAGSNPSSG